MSAADALQREINRLVEVCMQLDSLANDHPKLAEALLGIAGSLRNSATLPGTVGGNEIVKLRSGSPVSNAVPQE